jgi:hypothetical protein
MPYNDVINRRVFIFLYMILFYSSSCATQCPCDCPGGCQRFSLAEGELSDGSSNACLKNGFGPTGQYGECDRYFSCLRSPTNYFDEIDVIPTTKSI